MKCSFYKKLLKLFKYRLPDMSIAGVIKTKSFHFWRGFIRLTEEPTAECRNQNGGRVIAAGCYVTSLMAAIFISYMAINSAGHVQNSSPVQSENNIMPDLIFCPRPGFAAVLAVNASNEDIKNEPSEYQRRRVRHLDETQQIMRRARAHEDYDNVVWYNVELIDWLNMSKQHVNHFTMRVRKGGRPDLEPNEQKYVEMIRLAVRHTFEHDLDVLKADKIDPSKSWKLPLHPRLQQLFLEQDIHTTPEKDLLWMAITKPVYIDRYSDEDVEPYDLLQHRRFKCVPTSDCTQKMRPIWLDKYHCVMFTGLAPAYIYQPEIFDETQIWLGNAKLQTIKMEDFWTSRIREDRWLQMDAGVAFGIGIVHVKATRTAEMRAPVFQSLINVTGNDDAIKNTYANLQSPVIRDYNLWKITLSGPKSYYKLSIVGIRALETSPQFSTIQLVSMAGGVLGMINGFSISQVIQLSFVKFHRKIRARLDVLVSAILLLGTVILTSRDLMAAIDSDSRFVLSPDVTDYRMVPIPTMSISGYASGHDNAEMTLNHTKLAAYNVSVPLLKYLCVAATSRMCEGGWHIQGDKAVHYHSIISRFWPHPYEQLFRTIRPNATLLSDMHSQYAALAKRLNVDPDYEPAWNVLKVFLLDPCEIILGCQLGDEPRWDCCKEFVHRDKAEDLMLYAFYWSNAQNKRFETHDVFTVFIDMNQYRTHSDATVPYLGPQISKQDALKEVSVLQWSERGGLGSLWVFFQSATADLERSIVHFTTQVGNGKGIILYATVRNHSLLTRDEYPAATCRPTSVCSFFRSENGFSRYLAISRVCECQFYYNEPDLMMETYSNKSYCTAEQAVKCVTQDRFYSGHCRGRVMKGIKSAWDSNSSNAEPTLTLTEPNVLLYSQEHHNCGGPGMFTGRDNPINAPVDDQVDSRCDQRTCHHYRFSFIGRKWILDQTDEAFAVKLRMKDSFVPGIKQIDTLNVPGVIGLSLNTIGLLFGISILTLLDLIHTAFARINSPGTSFFAKLHRHWSRSIDFTGWQQKQPNNLVSDFVVPEPILVSTTPAAKIEHSPTTVEETPTGAHPILATSFSMCVLGVVMIFMSIKPYITETMMMSFALRFNETDLEPALALCTTEDAFSFVDLRKELNQVDGCEYRGKSISCSELFPLTWKPNFDHPYGISQCVVTNQLLYNTVTPVPIGSFTHNVYRVQNLHKSIFKFTWIGDLFEMSTINSKNSDDIGKLNALDPNSYRARFSYSVTKYKKAQRDNCHRRPQLNITVCEQTQNKTNTNNLCAFSKQGLQQLPLINQDDWCVAWEYLHFKHDLTEQMSMYAPLFNDKNQLTQTVEVRTEDYYAADIIEGSTYHWAVQLTMFGGYFDQLIGISILNMLFVMISGGIYRMVRPTSS